MAREVYNDTINSDRSRDDCGNDIADD